MNDWLVPSKYLPAKSLWLRSLVHSDFTKATRVAAYVGLTLYAVLTFASYYSTLGPHSLGIEFESCEGNTCVDWVMPAGIAWDAGARPGMTLKSIDGEAVTPATPSQISTANPIEYIVNDSSGNRLTITSPQSAFSEDYTKFSLWGLGAVFALLGVGVALRRPDFKSARRFGLFAIVTAIALTIGPSSSSASQSWALAIQFMSLVIVGATCVSFCASLVGFDSSRFYKPIITTILFIAAAVLSAYVVAVVQMPSIYEIVRPTGFLVFAVSMLFGITILAIASFRNTNSALAQQARIALAGVATSSFPFVGLSLIPQVLGQDSLVPIHLSVLAIGIMPVFFAYSLLHHQLFGIRKFVHRGMVYAISSIALLTITSIALSALFSAYAVGEGRVLPVPATALIIVAGVILFYPLSGLSRKLVDSLIYEVVPDYTSMMDAVRDDILTQGQTRDIARSIATILENSLQLESVLLFLGDSPQSARLVARVGDQSTEVLTSIYPNVKENVDKLDSQESVNVAWGSDSLMLVSLSLPGTYFGHILLGPKLGGEILLREERQLVSTLIPVLALTIEKSVQSQELRVLNEKLTRAGEAERGRIATDIHDGPLQKALLLAGVGGSNINDPSDVARNLASELREICSRLRPAVLDDLGLVFAIDWLLGDIGRRHDIDVDLRLLYLNDDDRFFPDVELALFRVAQEATNNAIKHASGGSISVVLERYSDALELTVSDSGQGFDPELVKPSGFGLPGMKERIAQLDGLFQIRTAPGLGTSVVARIPLAKSTLEEADDDAVAIKSLRS